MHPVADAGPAGRSAGRRASTTGVLIGAMIALALQLIGGPGHSAAETLRVVESQYNTIIVEKKGGHLHMYFGYGSNRYTQTVRKLDDPRALPVPYTRYLTLSLAYAASTARIAEIGAAAGQTSSYLARSLPHARITAVELDGAVLKLAREYFGLRDIPNLSLVEKDGRVFLTRTRERFDLILIDAYRGPFVPFHLTTREFYQTAARRLSPGGALALNIEPSTLLFVPTVVTLSHVFDHVDLYPAKANIVAIAYNGKELSDAELQSRASAVEARHPLRYSLRDMLAGRQRFVRPDGDSNLLTDDFAPVEFLRSIKRHNERRQPAAPAKP